MVGPQVHASGDNPVGVAHHRRKAGRILRLLGLTSENFTRRVEIQFALGRPRALTGLTGPALCLSGPDRLGRVPCSLGEARILVKDTEIRSFVHLPSHSRRVIADANDRGALRGPRLSGGRLSSRTRIRPLAVFARRGRGWPATNRQASSGDARRQPKVTRRSAQPRSRSSRRRAIYRRDGGKRRAWVSGCFWPSSGSEARTTRLSDLATGLRPLRRTSATLPRRYSPYQMLGVRR